MLSQPLPAAAPRPRILLVDDDFIGVRLLTEVLKPSYEVAAACNGLMAMSSVSRNRPDLILLDVMMPELDGFEVLRRLKQDPLTADIPVVMLTALDGEDDQRRAQSLGAMDYICKPIQTQLIKVRVDHYLNHEHVRQEEGDLSLLLLREIAEGLSGDVVLPTHAPVHFRILQDLNDPRLDLAALLRRALTEPFLAARLGAIGLAAQGPASPARPLDLAGAVAAAGEARIRHLLRATTQEQIKNAKHLPGVQALSRALWRHSLRNASAARVISARLTDIDPDTAMLAGLVHDIGAFYVLFQATRFEALRARPDLVRSLVGQWHEGAGHALLLALGLPRAFADAIQEHDLPKREGDAPRSLAEVVHLATLLAGDMFDPDGNFADGLPGQACGAVLGLLAEIGEYEASLRVGIGD